MEYAIELGATFDGCPSSWKNFIIDLRQRYTLKYSEETATTIINELALYNAHMPVASIDPELIDDTVETVLLFDTPEDRTWFLLKWT